MINIHILQAGYGDSLLVDISEKNAGQVGALLLVDCGFNYGTNIKPLLQNLGVKGRSIDRFIITHFDDDHINGAAKFIQDNGPSKAPQIIPIKEVWLNTYRHLQFTKQRQSLLEDGERDCLETFIRVNSLPKQEPSGQIGARQAMILGRELLRFGYVWNQDFQGKAITAEQDSLINISESIKVIILSPQKVQLERLEKDFELELGRWDIKVSDTSLIDDAFELFSIQEGKETVYGYSGPISSRGEISRISLEYLYNNSEYVPDDAPGNGSSIAFVLEADGKRVLFLADAHAEIIVEGLKNVYPDSSSYPIYFDAVKVAHHGSIRNNSRELIEMIDSPNFMISTNGKHPRHKHPDLETLAFIVCRKLSNGIKKRNVIFNYSPEHLDGFFAYQLMEELNYVAKVSTKVELI